MIFYIGDKKYEYSEEEMENRLISDKGTEGLVYKIDGKAVKIYKYLCFKYRLQEDLAMFLQNIKTDRILLPQELVYNEYGKFNGYTSKYIKAVNNDRLRLIKMKQLLREIKYYESDIEKLTDENISIADLNMDNIVLSKGIYFCDPGSFDINSKSNRFVKVLNETEVRDFFVYQIMANFSSLSRNKIRKLGEYFSYDTHLSNMLEAENFDENESMQHFVKKLVNK